MDEFLENAAAMFVAFKLVKAGAGGGQQHDFTWAGGAGGGEDRFVQRYAGVNGDNAAQVRLDLGGG